jgi:hypothetical protein
VVADVVICIELWFVRCGEPKPNAAAANASARIESSASDIFKFFKIEPPESVDEAHSHEVGLRFGRDPNPRRCRASARDDR